jgi:hypothetical protein
MDLFPDSVVAQIAKAINVHQATTENRRHSGNKRMKEIAGVSFN